MREFESSVIVLDKVLSSISQRTGKPKMPCGIDELDDLIWGIHKRELLIIGARPSHGKTSLALQIAWNISDMGHKVIFNSLEMSRENIVERLACSEFQINGWKLRKGFKDEMQRFQAVGDRMRARLLKNSFEIVDYKGWSIGQTKEILEQFKPDCLFIDHVQKISARGYGSKYEALADYAHRLQDLAIEYDCAVVLNSQIQRSGEFLKGAGELEECADTLLFCKWLFRESDTADPKDFEISVEKQRHGPCDTAMISFDGGCYRFSSKYTSDAERLIGEIR